MIHSGFPGAGGGCVCVLAAGGGGKHRGVSRGHGTAGSLCCGCDGLTQPWAPSPPRVQSRGSPSWTLMKTGLSPARSAGERLPGPRGAAGGTGWTPVGGWVRAQGGAGGAGSAARLRRAQGSLLDGTLTPACRPQWGQGTQQERKP